MGTRGGDSEAGLLGCRRWQRYILNPGILTLGLAWTNPMASVYLSTHTVLPTGAEQVHNGDWTCRTLF